MFINWNYTNACNFHCSHCYSRAPEYEDELDESGYALIVKKLIDHQVFRVGFGGGEPLVRGDFLQTLMALGAAGVYTHFTTNGWLVDPVMAESLRQCEVGRISVSFDSPIEPEHDEIRCRPGSFERATRACSHLLDTGCKTWISATITRVTCDKISEYFELAKRLDVSGINFKVFRPAGNGLVLKERFGLNSEQLSSAANEVNALTPTASFGVSMYGPESNEPCSCGRTTLTIRPNGEVVTCPYGSNVVGDLSSESLSEVWKRVDLAQGQCQATQDSVWPLGRREMSDDSVRRHLVNLGKCVTSGGR